MLVKCTADGSLSEPVGKCEEICGDKITVGDEECDGSTGCSPKTCKALPGFVCKAGKCAVASSCLGQPDGPARIIPVAGKPTVNVICHNQYYIIDIKKVRTALATSLLLHSVYQMSHTAA